MSIRPALDALLEALQAAGIPLVASLAPGLSRAEIDAKVASLSGHLAAEVTEYFEWRNGLALDREVDLELFPQGIPLSLDEAVAQYGLQRTVAGQIAQQAGVPAGTIWDERWFPLFHNGAGDYHLTLLGPVAAGTTPVHGVTNDDRQTTFAYDSLTALIETTAECWKSGAYTHSGDGTIDEDRPAAAEIIRAHNPERMKWALEWTDRS